MKGKKMWRGRRTRRRRKGREEEDKGRRRTKEVKMRKGCKRGTERKQEREKDEGWENGYAGREGIEKVKRPAALSFENHIRFRKCACSHAPII